MDRTKFRLQDTRGGAKAILGQHNEAMTQPTAEHREMQPTSSSQNSTGQRAVAPALSAPAAQNHNKAPPVQAVPHFSAKPAFTRGISVVDQTAVTSAAPTPAGEISNPMSFGVGQSIARQRESHLPDVDLLAKVRAMSTVNRTRHLNTPVEEDE